RNRKRCSGERSPQGPESASRAFRKIGRKSHYHPGQTGKHCGDMNANLFLTSLRGGRYSGRRSNLPDRLPRSLRFACLPAGRLAMTASCLLLSGCSKYYYNPAPQILPQYISKLAIRPFANRTKQYGLEEKLTLAVQQLFNLDGRYQITTEDQADGVL